MSCDLCGKAGTTSLAQIEGSTFRVCSSCAQYGKQIREVHKKPPKPKRVETRVVSSNAANILRKAREKTGLSQDAFADKHGLRRPDVHAWEHGSRLPTVETALKLEKILHVSLLEQEATEPLGSYVPSSSGGGLTLGDFIKKK